MLLCTGISCLSHHNSLYHLSHNHYICFLTFVGSYIHRSSSLTLFVRWPSFVVIIWPYQIGKTNQSLSFQFINYKCNFQISPNMLIYHLIYSRPVYSCLCKPVLCSLTKPTVLFYEGKSVRTSGP